MRRVCHLQTHLLWYYPPEVEKLVILLCIAFFVVYTLYCLLGRKYTFSVIKSFTVKIINLWTSEFHCFWTCQLELSTSVLSRSILITWTIPSLTKDISVPSGLRYCDCFLGFEICMLQILELNWITRRCFAHLLFIYYKIVHEVRKYIVIRVYCDNHFGQKKAFPALALSQCGLCFSFHLPVILWSLNVGVCLHLGLDQVPCIEPVHFLTTCCKRQLNTDNLFCAVYLVYWVVLGFRIIVSLYCLFSSASVKQWSMLYRVCWHVCMWNIMWCFAGFSGDKSAHISCSGKERHLRAWYGHVGCGSWKGNDLHILCTFICFPDTQLFSKW